MTEEVWPCWSCGQHMPIRFGSARFCEPCDVWESPGGPSRIALFKEGMFEGVIVPYIDHGAEHWPSPALKGRGYGRGWRVSMRS